MQDGKHQKILGILGYNISEKYQMSLNKLLLFLIKQDKDSLRELKTAAQETSKACEIEFQMYYYKKEKLSISEINEIQERKILTLCNEVMLQNKERIEMLEKADQDIKGIVKSLSKSNIIEFQTPND